MNEVIIFTKDDFDKLKGEIVRDLEAVIMKRSTPPRWMRSADVRKLLGGISAAKLQSLRVGGHLPATDANGLWLYCYDDVVEFLERNKTTGKEGKHE
jgi:hypothetical protein